MDPRSARLKPLNIPRVPNNYPINPMGAVPTALA